MRPAALELDPRVAEAARILRQELHAVPTPAELGKRLGMSEFTLMRQFKAGLGLRIGEYVLWQRLLTALGRFDGRRKLADIAQEAGFYDQAHLTRTARRMADLPPSFFSDSSRTRVRRCAE
jgi:AraC-like DNA-binding protein